MSKRRTGRPDIAIALRYDGRDAPRVTAKGEAELAGAICRIAEEHGVPLYENPQLAVVLSQIELGEEIPDVLYRAVAEVIAFAYVLSGRVCGVAESGDEDPTQRRGGAEDTEND